MLMTMQALISAYPLVIILGTFVLVLAAIMIIRKMLKIAVAFLVIFAAVLFLSMKTGVIKEEKIHFYQDMLHERVKKSIPGTENGK